MIKLETKFTKKIIAENKLISLYQSKIKKIMGDLLRKKSAGVEMTGWINYPKNYDKAELNQMVKTANAWHKQGIKKVVVIGIGGSYLGAKAGVDMLSAGLARKNIQVYFAHNFNQNFIVSLLKEIGTGPFGIIVISKSGTTLEPGVAFDLFYKKLVSNIGTKKANKLVVAVTDKEKGNFASACKINGWAKFIIPNDIGGRYSVITPVGMYLFILAGLDYKAILKGAKDAATALMNIDLKKNSAFKYACYRHYFKTIQKIDVENFIVYDPSLQMICEVWKQLFGESEGKNHTALYPSISLFTTDLHSMGQYLQEGTRNFFETTLYVKTPINDVELSMDFDNMKYLNGKKLSYINNVAMLSTVKAHYEDGDVGNLIIYLDKQDGYHFGYLYIWMCFAAMASAYLLKVNPFDQPGVEVYKKRISSILKK